MTLPSNSSVNFQVVLDFLLQNEEVVKRVVQETEGLTDAKEKAATAEKVLRDETGKTLSVQEEAARVKKLNTEALKANSAEIRIQVKELRAQAKEIATRNKLLLDSAADIDRVAKPLQQYGLLVVGGIFAAANKYVNSAKEATEVTVAWKKAQDSLNESGMRIGAVLAQEALPLLKQAAELAEKIASFTEKHPEMIGVALKAGLLAITLGTIGKAVSGGIRLYADFKMDAALTLQMTAAELQLQAARMQINASGVKSLVPGGAAPATGAAGSMGAGVTGVLGKTIAGVALGEILAVLGGLFVGVKGYDALFGGKNGYAKSNAFAPAFAYEGTKKFGNAIQGLTGDSDKEIERKSIVFAAVVGRLTHAIDENSSLWTSAAKSVEAHKTSLKEDITAQTVFYQQEASLRMQDRTDRIKLMMESAKTEAKIFRDSQLQHMRDLGSSLLQEFNLRRSHLKAGLSDLASGLLAELKLKRDYVTNLLQSVGDMFKKAIEYIKSLFRLGGSSSTSASGVGSAGSSQSSPASSTWSFANLFGTKDTGGYVDKSIQKMAWDGRTEFVLANPTMKSLEKLVGGKLTQSNILQAAQRGGQYIIQNNQRFDGEITSAMIRAVNQSIEGTLREVFAS